MALAVHRTAIGRTKPSVPAKLMVERGLVAAGMSVLDFGCGRGADFRFFNDLGAKAYCYDPFNDEYKIPPGAASRFDRVTITYVPNVIETAAGRLEMVKAAAHYVKVGGMLIMTARNVADIDAARKQAKAPWVEQGDGWVTSSGSFQKGLTPDEVCGLVKAAGLRPEPWEVPGASACVGTRVGGLAGLFGRR